ncbi:hypothetical protein CYLTODRAFT_416364 [Cylindrobasidium torrendii FP15055 ss-10]|uniref:Uncharacterized protein n=1 Tax=Cylindrobasidium torrendii FP15055 ss-10 TaxID=1314674 RepID=A0A0D7BV22_9AGAR|nr:hypothetical protein CYLTODRAFT_416364 [Cylindrobasidium torrendii FP15055 ss-10]
MSGRRLERCSWFDDDGVKIPYTPGCKLGRFGKCPDVHPDHPDWALATRTKNMARPWPNINDFDGNPLYSKAEAAKKIPLEAQKNNTWDKWDLGKPKSKKKKKKSVPFNYRPFSLSPSQRSPSPEMSRYHEYESRRDRDRERSRSPRRRDAGWGPRSRPEGRTWEDDDDVRSRRRSDDTDRRRADDDKRDRARPRWDESRRANSPDVRKDREMQDDIEHKPSEKALGKRRAASPVSPTSLSSKQSPKVKSPLITDTQPTPAYPLLADPQLPETPLPTVPTYELSTYQIPSLPVLSGDVHQQRITLLLQIFKLRGDLEALRSDRARYAEDMRNHYDSGTSDFILPSIHQANAQLAAHTQHLEQAIATTETALFALPDTQPASISSANFHLNQVELMKFFDQAEVWLKAIELVRVDIREALEVHATSTTPGQPSIEIAPLKLRAWPELPSLGHFNRRLGDYQEKVSEFQNEVEAIQRTDVGETSTNALQQSTVAQQLLKLEDNRSPAHQSIEDRLGYLENGIGALVPNDMRAQIDAREKRLETVRVQHQEMMQTKAMIKEKLDALEQKALERKSALHDLRKQIIRLHELREPAPERILKPLMEALVDQEVSSIRKAVDILNSFSKQAADRSSEEMQARVNKELEPAMQRVRTIRATAHSMQYNRQ